MGTLVLEGATFAAIRSSNRSARVAERSLLAGLQPILVVAGRDDPVEEVQFADGRTFKAGHGSALSHHDGHVIYMAVPLRNARAGVAYLYGYRLEAEPARNVQAEPRDSARHRRGDDAPDPSNFSVQQRDLYVAPGETGFWQVALRDPTAPIYLAALDAPPGPGPCQGRPPLRRHGRWPTDDHSCRLPSRARANLALRRRSPLAGHAHQTAR